MRAAAASLQFATTHFLETAGSFRILHATRTEERSAAKTIETFASAMGSIELRPTMAVQANCFGRGDGVPFSMPLALMSSSTSGQCTPCPLPMNS